MPSHLKLVRTQLGRKLKSSARTRFHYTIPQLWNFKKGASRKMLKVDPYEYYLKAIDVILKQRPQRMKKGHGGSWTRDAVIYNMFLRSSAAFDHNRNGKLDLPVNAEGWRETGTFVKAIAMLPYIRSLGANTIHLLPITSIGSDGNKGTLGSPYAIKNPYELDDNLCEPHLGLGVGEEFKVFVEAAHRLGLRVVVEFVFRTSAKDGDWIKEHPEWFYWIKADIHDRAPGERNETKYGNPIFTPEELKSIRGMVEHHRLSDLLPPHVMYREMFTKPPAAHSISKEHGKWIGVLDDGTRVRIPGAFADWPPDDSQPPWGDVTYLKMYDHPDFNYIAYNTIRMYDIRLAQHENVNRSLWEKITGIIPHYQHEYGIDGVMIDMGHALPMELKQEMIHRARAMDPDFAFWDENFSVTEKSVKEGYNAVFGYQWADQHHPEKFKALIRKFSTEGFPLPYFATPENHNTPRAAARHGGTRYSRYAWALSNFLPAVPFLHSGFEIGERMPINTGLDFSKEELLRYPSDRLPLFSEYAYDWLDKDELTDWIRTVTRVRQSFASLIVDRSPDSFKYAHVENPHILAFSRTKGGKADGLLVAANSSMGKKQKLVLSLTTTKRHLKDMLTKKAFAVQHSRVTGTLSPGQVVVFEL